MARRTTDDDRVAALYEAGLSDVAIARELGVSRSGVRLARRRLGLAAHQARTAPPPQDSRVPSQAAGPPQHDMDLVEALLRGESIDVQGARLVSLTRTAKTVADGRLAIARAHREDVSHHTWTETDDILQWVMRQVWDRFLPAVGEDALRELDRVIMEYLETSYPRS